MPGKVLPSKRVKLDATTPNVFQDVESIQRALHSKDQHQQLEALTSLRNLLAARPAESRLAPTDERLLLAKLWIENDPGAHDIFVIWENSAQQRHTAWLTLVISLLASLLTIFSSHYTDHALGYPILKSLLAPSYMRHLSSYLGGSHNELILVTMRLLYNMSTFAGGRERKSLLEAFPWETKVLPKLLNMRRRSKSEDKFDPLLKPDIRTLYLLFILSFVDHDSQTQVKTMFLEHHRDVFLSVFKGLHQDPYTVVRKVLEICWSGLWSDAKVKRTVKISLFNETTIAHLMKLYGRSVTEDDAEHIPADLVHHFLLTICTRPGVGICFRDRGWYPRESDMEPEITKEDDKKASNRGRIYNKILANILKTLKVNEDARQQELALRILGACPELVASYWSGAALTLEPRLSSKWVTNISVFAAILSLPVPSSSFLLENSSLYQPTPPPLNAIMENIIPSVNAKVHFSKGLQSPSRLVQHCTALAISKCLLKLEAVLALFQKVEVALEEDPEEGQWTKRRRDVEREARRRVPEFQVIIAFSQQQTALTDTQVNPTRTALLLESAQRLLWLYQRCLPPLVAEARFDVSKLLQSFSVSVDRDSVHDKENVEQNSAGKLHRVRRLHVLRMLKDAEDFIWTGKAGTSSQSNFHILLKCYTATEIPAMRSTLASLLQYILSASILFQENRDEPQLWLECLPRYRRSQGTRSPDGAPLTDESDSVLVFLDECVQRCFKTPYKYIEDLNALSKELDENESVSRPDAHPSPLLLTVVEQFDSKVGNRTLSPSDVFALVSYMRKLIYRLMSQLRDLQLLKRVVEKVDTALGHARLFTDYPVISASVRREVTLMRRTLAFENVSRHPQTSCSMTVKRYLSEASTKHGSITVVYELIDWLRLLDEPLGPSEVRQVMAIVTQNHPPALLDVAMHLDPGSGSFFEAVMEVLKDDTLRKYLPFEWMYLLFGKDSVSDDAVRKILAESVLRGKPGLVDVKRMLCLLTHGLCRAQYESDEAVSGSLEVMASILENVVGVLSDADMYTLKEALFMRTAEIKEMMLGSSESEVVLRGKRRLVHVTLDPRSFEDRRIASDISSYWLHILKDDLKKCSVIRNLELALLWIQYLGTSELVDLMDEVADNMTEMPDSSLVDLMTGVLTAISLALTIEVQSEAFLRTRLPRMLSLQPILPNSVILQEMIADAIESTLPCYLDGNGPEVSEFGDCDLAPLVRRSERRWAMRGDGLPVEVPLEPFLKRKSATGAMPTAKIVAGLLYRQKSSHRTFIAWLLTGDLVNWDVEQRITVLHAFFDTSECLNVDLSTVDSAIWNVQFSGVIDVVLSARSRYSAALRTTAVLCAQNMLARLQDNCTAFCDFVVDRLSSMDQSSFTPEIIAVAAAFYTHKEATARSMVASVIDKGMQWVIRQFGDMQDVLELNRVCYELTSLVRIIKSSCKPHLVETLIIVLVQNQLSSVAGLKLANACLSTVNLKPLILNRHLQRIVQHPQFFEHASGSTAEALDVRDALIDLLKTMFNLHPANTCQVSHIEPLVHVYRGTLAISDMLILSIFQLFESQRRMSITPLLSKWSSSSSNPSSTALEALQGIDSVQVLRTCLHFPHWRHIHGHGGANPPAHDAQLLDPVFLILMFSQVLAECPPTTAFAWVVLFRTNIVSLLIRALSAKDEDLRDVALCQISALWKQLEEADIQEKPQIIYVLTQLKNLLPKPSSGDPAGRLPSYTTLLLAHALRGIFYPSNFIYPLTARFLLQRPELDTTDVPMLYSMLYSSSSDWKKERGWILRFLADGLVSTGDWRVFKRRHTWDLLASLYQSAESDSALRHGILDVLASLTCNARATTALLMKSALLPWIEMQLHHACVEVVQWLRILENVLFIVDANKLELATNGLWRAVVCRCITLILGAKDQSNSSLVFPTAVPLILRLCLLPGTPPAGLSALLDRCLLWLERLEADVCIPKNRPSKQPAHACRPIPPHTAQELHKLEHLQEQDLFPTWGVCVEMLWRASMTLSEKSHAWDALSSRLLVWRAVVGERDTREGEWVRRESVHTAHLLHSS